MAFKIQLRRDLAPRWTANNPVLLLGEFGYEYDSGWAKIGDGQSPWRDLPYFVGGTGPFGAKDFISLEDTPSGYTGSNEYYIRVNPNGTGLEFISLEMVTSLIDIRGATGFEPGDAGKYLRVNSGGTGFEWATIGGGTGGGTYFNDSLTLTKVGGIDSLTTFENVVLDRMWNALLHPEEEPGFETLSINPNGSTGPYIILEVGQNMTPTVNFYWEVRNEDEFKPNTVEIYDIKEDFQIATGLGITGSTPAVYSYSSSVGYNDKDSHTWRFTGIGKNEITFSKDLTVNWYYPIFYGGSSDEFLTNAQIPLLDRVVKPDSDGIYGFVSSLDEFNYICIPEDNSDYDIKGMTVNGIPLVLADSDDGYTSLDSVGLSYLSINPIDINGEIKTYRIYRSKYRIKDPIEIKVSKETLAVGLRLTGKIKPMSESETYPVLDPKYGVDGLRNVSLIGEMYSIPQERRKLGMVVGVGVTGNSGIYYKLIREPGSTLTTSLDWGVFNSGTITYTGGTGSTGGTGTTTISGVTGINIEGGERITVVLTEDPVGVAKYTVDIPQLISGGTA